jgi:hypothetical protein
MKTIGSGSIASPFLTLVLDGGEWSASRPGQFPPGTEPLVHIGCEAGWVPEALWKLWRRESLFALSGIEPAM